MPTKAKKLKAPKLPPRCSHMITLGLVAMFFFGCKQEPVAPGTPTTYRDSMNQQQYVALYNKWHSAVKAMPPYSKTTAYANLQEFSDIIACGRGIVPLLHAKIKEDEGMDFVLCLAVIKIMGWPDGQFPSTDMTELRGRVLQKLDHSK